MSQSSRIVPTLGFPQVAEEDRYHTCLRERQPIALFISRSISLTLFKVVFEVIIIYDLLHHLRSSNLLSLSQRGFNINRSSPIGSLLRTSQGTHVLTAKFDITYLSTLRRLSTIPHMPLRKRKSRDVFRPVLILI